MTLAVTTPRLVPSPSRRDEGSASRCTADFDDLSLEQGLRRLLAHRSYVLVYTPDGAPPPPDGRLKVVAAESDRTAGVSAVPLTPPYEGRPQPDPGLLAAVEAGGRGSTVPKRIQFLEGVLATEADAGTRAAALKMLTAVSPSALAAISRTAHADPSVEVRRRALELLVVEGQSNGLVIDTLLAIAGTDPDAGMREQAKVFAENLDASRQAHPLRRKP